MQATTEFRLHRTELFQYNASHFYEHAAKNQSPAQIQKCNFELSYVLISLLWCLKYIDMWMTPFGPLYGVTGGSECPKNDQIENLNGHSIETKLGGKVLVFYAYSWAIFRFSWNFLITEKTENFFQILCLEILKHHF